MISLSKEQARKFLIRCQELSNPRQLKTDHEIMLLFSRFGCIQYDPLDRVGRNADLTLQSRVKNYTEDKLYELLYKKRLLTDGWDKNMSIYPLSDYPNFERYRQGARNEYQKRKDELGPVIEKLKKIIGDKGPVNSAELKIGEKVGWSWSPANITRAALETALNCGELIISHKSGTRKYYDFAERYIPKDILSAPDPNKTEEDFYAWYASRRIKSLGLLKNGASDAWLGNWGFKSEVREKAFKRLIKNKEIFEINIKGINYPVYAHIDNRKFLEDNEHKNTVSIIAPLDNFLWDRKLINALFDFEYRWEVYTPAAKRKYGYYVLPVLCGDKFIARFEAVRDKKTKTLKVLEWWPEPGFENGSPKAETRDCFRQFLSFNKCEDIEYSGTKKQSWIGDI